MCARARVRMDNVNGNATDFTMPTALRKINSNIWRLQVIFAFQRTPTTSHPAPLTPQPPTLTPRPGTSTSSPVSFSAHVSAAPMSKPEPPNISPSPKASDEPVACGMNEAESGQGEEREEREREEEEEESGSQRRGRIGNKWVHLRERDGCTIQISGGPQHSAGTCPRGLRVTN